MLPLLLICCLLPFLFRGPGQRPTEITREADSWITPQQIEEVFNNIVREVENWKKEILPERKTVFPFGKKEEKREERFIVSQSIPPRLLRVTDTREGEIVFELMEIEGDGTSVKVSFSPPAKQRVQTFKAQFPAKILTGWQSCPSCGKPILPDFVVCPYCGQRLKVEGT